MRWKQSRGRKERSHTTEDEKREMGKGKAEGTTRSSNPKIGFELNDPKASNFLSRKVTGQYQGIGKETE